MDEPNFRIEAGRRVGMCGDTKRDWYVSDSPRNGEMQMIEGCWEDWVCLAKQILEENDRRIREVGK